MTKSKLKTKTKPKKSAKAAPARAKKSARAAKPAKKPTRKKGARPAPPSPPSPLPTPATVGAVVSGTDPCACGDAPEEHGHDAAHHGSTACTIDGCGCVAYEAAPESDEADA